MGIDGYDCELGVDYFVGCVFVDVVDMVDVIDWFVGYFVFLYWYCGVYGIVLVFVYYDCD